MTITFEKDIHWTPALEGVVTWARVDGKRVGCVFEGRVIAEHFGAENSPSRIEAAFWVNRAFLWDIARDAIERGMFNRFGEVLLGKHELLPYFEKSRATAPA